MTIKNFRFRGELMLLMAAMIWGGAFVAQSVASDSVGPFTFNCARSLIGALALVPVFLLTDKFGARRAAVAPGSRKMLWLGALVCGAAVTVAINLQQGGISYVDTTALSEAAQKANVGKAGFLTALYIVLVPVFGIFLRKRTGLFVWLSVSLALIGMYFLCVKGAFTIGKGDIYVLLCAAAFAVHILAVDYFAPRVDCVKLSCLQFLVAGVLSGICMFIYEKPSLASVLDAWSPILYTGVMSSGIAYTLQILGQKNAKPAVASLIMSMESVFSAVFGFLILGQTLTNRELVGCALMFAAVVLSQVKPRARL